MSQCYFYMETSGLNFLQTMINLILSFQIFEQNKFQIKEYFLFYSIDFSDTFKKLH